MPQMRSKDGKEIMNLRFENGDLLRPASDKSSPFDHKLIGNIVKNYPEASEIMERYFGEGCLKRTGFKIKTPEIACILFGVDQNRLIQEIDKI
jgi:hypothetical protein